VLLSVFILAFVAHKAPQYLEGVLDVDRLTFSTLSRMHVWIAVVPSLRPERESERERSNPYAVPSSA